MKREHRVQRAANDKKEPLDIAERVERVEKIEADLDNLIEKRAESSVATQETQRWWIESEREYHAEKRRENAAAWRAFHNRMRQLHAGLADEHAAKAEALEEEEA